jgi:hypothetical protein
MNVEIGAEAALFPEKEYINGIAVAVQMMGPKQFFLIKLAIVGIKKRPRHKAIKVVKKEHQKADFLLPIFYRL